MRRPPQGASAQAAFAWNGQPPSIGATSFPCRQAAPCWLWVWRRTRNVRRGFARSARVSASFLF